MTRYGFYDRTLDVVMSKSDPLEALWRIHPETITTILAYLFTRNYMYSVGGPIFFLSKKTNCILSRKKKLLDLLLFTYIFIVVACIFTYQTKFYDHPRCVLHVSLHAAVHTSVVLLTTMWWSINLLMYKSINISHGVDDLYLRAAFRLIHHWIL